MDSTKKKRFLEHKTIHRADGRKKMHPKRLQCCSLANIHMGRQILAYQIYQDCNFQMHANF